ncbi:two component transcriptional regulator, AraC family [Marinobacter daqiaonensis]|uniref:Two component transcriptional regulator, AraC family n=1 Tax=Marinobacter daqiaonensis TaxID=650891 RepID=A0A1I6JGH8_9GAMM|nr:DNA-binding response regulator [Marinobacter daqiaonensis]SFR78106.1 two component transcriptional regulator, AraC family [Marinobacter daqiaonensis]
MDSAARILIVVRNVETDSPDNYGALLERQGYQVEYVPSGQCPLAAIRKKTPLVVLFQFDYPDLPGLASLRETKQQIPSVPVIMITQAHSEQLAVWAFRARVWDYFVHPIDTKRLIDVADTLTKIRQGRPAKRTELDQGNTIPPEARLRCSGSREEQAILDQVLTYVDNNLHRKIVQLEVAKRFDLSPFQFSRLFKRLTTVTFQSYLLTRRVEEAKRLLANPKISITDVCFTVGFQDLSYFTRVFQRHVGITPSHFRRSVGEKPATASKEELLEQAVDYEVLFTSEKPEPVKSLSKN